MKRGFDKPNTFNLKNTCIFLLTFGYQCLDSPVSLEHGGGVTCPLLTRARVPTVISFEMKEVLPLAVPRPVGA